MRLGMVLTMTVLLVAHFVISATVQPQPPKEDKRPNFADYPQAGRNCKDKRMLAPLLTFPAVGPGKSRCRLTVFNCKTGITDEYLSDPKPSGTVDLDCKDYYGDKDELQRIEFCCDKEEVKCSPPTSWFSSSSTGCKDVQSPKITRAKNMVTLSLCGYPIWSQSRIWGGTRKPDIEGAIETNDALMARVKDRIGSSICCDKFREAVNSGSPCDPRADLDCDGKSNRDDTSYPQRYVSSRDNETYSYPLSLPDINIFSRPDGASIDPFPPGLNPDDPNFIPPSDKCDCKWELVKGTLLCSPDGKQNHVYQATWKCPSTGNERFTRKEAPATAPCKK